jgi:hypothetical protein
VLHTGEIDMVVPAKYTHQVFAFDNSTQHLFYGPVLAFIRKTLIELEDETGVVPVEPVERALVAQAKRQAEHQAKIALEEEDVNIDDDDGDYSME